MKIRNFIENCQAQIPIGNITGLAKMFLTLIFVVIALIVAAVISLFWGMFGILGFFLLCAAIYYALFIKKGKVTMKLNSIFLWLLLLGIIFLLASYAGLEIYHVDLSFIPGAKTVSMNLLHQNPCQTCP